MRIRPAIHWCLPILLLLLVAAMACGQDAGEQSTPVALPAAAPTEAPTPLTSAERAAIDDFEAQLQTIDEEWDKFYDDFEAWRGGLVECHPATAREALRGLASSFAALSEEARNLPRTPATFEFADLVIAATEAEQAAFRQLRDRWQAGNVTLFELVEQRRTESALAQNTAADRSLALQRELRDAPTLDEIDYMERFSSILDAIADEWDDFHDAYAAFSKRESKLEEEERAVAYQELVAQLGAVKNAIDALETSDISEDFVDALQEAAEDEVAALQFLADFPPDLSEEPMTDEDGADGAASAGPPPAAAMVPTPAAPAVPETAPAAPQSPSATAAAPATGVDGKPEPQPTPTPTKQVAPQAFPVRPTAAPETESDPMTPIEDLKSAISATQALLAIVDQSIDVILNDKSAQSLEELDEFDIQLGLYVGNWDQFYEVYNEWRSTGGGCDSVAVGEILTGYSQQAAALARMVDDLPQNGLLLPVYGLAVDAAERESGAIRTLANNWTPFAVDAFKAADDERVNAARLRRQAGIALTDLKSRP